MTTMLFRRNEKIFSKRDFEVIAASNYEESLNVQQKRQSTGPVVRKI